MARYDPHHSNHPSGILRKLAIAFVFLTLSGVALSLVLISIPQKLDGIGGLDSPDGGRDVAAVLRESHQRQVPATLTEAEINQWLARVLDFRQGGRFEESVTFKRIAVRITEGLAEVIMEREIGGRSFTVSMFITIDQSRNGDRLRTELNLHGGGYASWLPSPPRGGRLGLLVVPQGFLRLVLPAYEALAEAVSEELDNGFRKMIYIRFEDKRIELDPRVPRREAGSE